MSEAGTCIDQLASLDAAARPKPTPPVKVRAKRGISRIRAMPIPETPEIPGLADGTIPDEALPLNVQDALEAMAAGEGGHAALVALAGKLASQSVPETTAVALLTYAADQRPPERRDAGWKRLRADIPRTVRWAADKAAEAEAPLRLPSPETHKGNGAASPPPPPPGAGTGAGGAVPPQPQPSSSTSMGRALMRERRPKYAGNLANVITCLLERPELAGCVAFDRMAVGISLRRALPGEPALTTPRPWTDHDTSRLQDFLQRTCQMTRVGREVAQQGADYVAQIYAFHPVQDYLNSLTWDGTPRADTWLSRYLGVELSDYARTTGRMWLIGMVARIMRPGAKFDYMLILEGLQGTLKSRVCVALCGPWVSDQSLDIRHDARAASQHLRNKWLVEVSELTFFRQADVETLKAFITRTHEQYLPRYARNEVVEPRQCGFVGTTNQDAYLHDPTGNRRFWPHRTGRIDVRALMRDRDQLWAEVIVAYRAGEHWWPEEDFEARVIHPEQQARYDADAWLEPIGAVLESLSKPKQEMRARGEREPNGMLPRGRATLLQVWQAAMSNITTAYGGTEATTLKFDRPAQIRTREILQFLGWRRGKLHDGRMQWEEPL